MQRHGPVVRVFIAGLVLIFAGFSRGEDAKSSAQTRAVDAQYEETNMEDPFADEEEQEEPKQIHDPLEKLNRVIFKLNDKLYFWVLKPVAKHYRRAIPERGRVSIRRLFRNAETPIRTVNCLLQGKVKKTGTELSRFVINTTIGIGGLFDPAKEKFGLQRQDEDFGQTLGKYGLGHVIYLNLPILGPSSARDGVGLLVDGLMRPWPYFLPPWPTIAVSAYRKVNATSLNIEGYESMKAGTVDPYVSFRNAYVQNRRAKIQD